MRKETREQFNGYMDDVARLNRVNNALGEQFTVEPEVQQVFQDMKGESADFLNEINTPLVEAPKGQKIGFGIGSPLASRTNTDENERKTRYVGTMNADQYETQKTNFDSHIKYSQVDSWAYQGDLAERYGNQVVRQVARDTLMIGWNGESVAAETDRDSNPKLQDVNIGWLKKIRNNRPQNLMGYDSDGQETGDAYKIGEGGKYGTLDAAVFDITLNLLDAWYQDSDDLLVIVGKEIWSAHGMGLMNNSNLPTERNALKTWFADKAVAGMPAITVPYFPKRGVLVTSFDNLSVYTLADSLRRTIIDNAKRDRIEEYLSSNDAFVVEDYGKAAGIRDGAVLLPDGEGGWA